MKENIIFGLRPVIEAISAGKQIDKLMMQKGLQGQIFHELLQLVKDNGIHIQYVPIEKLNYTTHGNHQGVIAFVSPITYMQISEIVPELIEQGKNPLVVILDRITDVRNFGAIARTCECCGVHAIIVPEKETAQINADAMKTSAGALNIIPVCKEKNLYNTVKYLKSNGFNVIGCTEKSDKYIYKADYSKPTAIVMGSEEDGISPQILKIMDELLAIPILGEVKSLNVSVATAMILGEVVRQRM
ncbi:MAG: 23S rRNA (guanosine(2251)-2'-O)-methyltransferase RlmB [Bacteroidota bacterium]